jgi:nucleoside-diphosphate-sugar epimerase
MGSSGFIGARLVAALRAEGLPVRGASRQHGGDATQVVADLSDPSSLLSVCHGVETIYHCAGHAHAFASLTTVETDRHWQVNFEGTRNLVEAAGKAGVERFVFLSSVKAMADPGDQMVDESFLGEPETAYGKSKLAAERAVLDAARRFGMHVVNLRLTMVYGSGGRGNLERMGRLVARGLFPPLPETGNHRSLIHVDDVIAGMRLVATDGRAAGGTYILAGNEAPSGRQLYDAIRAALGMPPVKWSVPRSLLALGAAGGDLVGQVMRRRMPLNGEVLDRLLNSAWYSSQLVRSQLGWAPKVTLQAGLREMLGR